MNQEQNKKIVIRISLKPKIVEAVNILMEELKQDSPQDLMRTLVNNEILRTSKARMRSTGGGAEPRTSKKQRRAMLEDLPDDQFLAAIQPHIDREFRRPGEDPSIVIERNITGQRIIKYASQSEKWESPIEDYLNQWEREGRL